MGRLVEPWSAGSAAGRDLLAPWSEPARGYHDVQHLTEVLAHVDTLAPGHLTDDLLAAARQAA